MNEQIHWFSVEGRLFCEKENVRFQKYPDIVRKGALMFDPTLYM